MGRNRRRHERVVGISFSAQRLPCTGTHAVRGEQDHESRRDPSPLMGSDGNRTAAAMTTHVATTTGRREPSPQCRDAVAGSSGILGPIALPLLPFAMADASAKKHNSVLAREYLAMALPHYIPRGETRGLVFFQVPKGAAMALKGHRVRSQAIGPRGSAEHWQIEIPFMGP
jgi:hypothetical protein